MAEVPAVPDHHVDLGDPVTWPRDPVAPATSAASVAFIIGCARSGTSILGEAIAAHPRVAYLFEASEVWNDLFPGKPDHRLTAADATPDAASAARGALEEARRGLTGDVLVEKNPKHVLRVPFLDAVFPAARFVHVVRDGRDVAASLMFRNRGDRWGHLEVPGWRELLARYPVENHIRCAHQWRDALVIARRDARSLPPERYLEARYEDLVESPAEVVARVLGFLGLPQDPAVDAFLPRIQDATEGSYHARKQVRHYLENHARRIGRHQENLTPEQVREIEAVCMDLLRELGYLAWP